MSSIASTPGAPFQRFAAGFGRVAAVLSVLGLLAAVGLSVPSTWFHLGHHGSSGSQYADMTPAAPVRMAIGASGVQLVAPLVSATTDPRDALHAAPDDAPLVGWWDHSAKAGAAKGQTVLLAHAGATGGGLTQIVHLAKGDFVDLLTKQGTMRYQVATVRTFDPKTIDRVGITLFKQDGGAGRLVMISAEKWDGSTYQRDVVVTAMPLGSLKS